MKISDNHRREKFQNLFPKSLDLTIISTEPICIPETLPLPQLHMLIVG